MAPTNPAGALGRVVVIGGNGFLGHHIISQALDKSHWAAESVASVDLRCGHNRIDGATYHECDITDTDKLSALIGELKPDVVIHTASPTASGAHSTSKEVFRKVNVDGTKSVVEACQGNGVKGLVYTSSASIMSDNEADLRNADERWPVIRSPQQKEYYSETKAAAEELVLAANRKDDSNLLTAALRPAGIFGEGDVQLVSGVLRVMRNGKTGVQLGDNTNIFDFTYVGNVAHAHLLAAQLLLATHKTAVTPLDHERVDGEAFIITNDSPCYFWDFTRSIWRAAGQPFKPGPAEKNIWSLSRTTACAIGVIMEIAASITGSEATFTKQRAMLATMTRYYNITKAKRVLGYEPRWTLPEGVERSVAWFLDQDKKDVKVQ